MGGFGVNAATSTVYTKRVGGGSTKRHSAGMETPGGHSTAGLAVLVRFTLALLAVMALASCAALPRNPVPAPLHEDATVPGLEGARTWADSMNPAFQANLEEAVAQRLAYLDAHQLTLEQAGASFLAISGGGDYGAFGAGVLCGWTQRGDRPHFNLVTGVSTGALIAPFAFLGEEYDDKLRQVYTTVDAEKIFFLKRIFSIIGGESVADTKPLAALSEQFIDAAMLERIAREHANGRRLFVATTNLDARRAVIWDMGAIASQGRLQLFHQVLLASAAIPAVFPPVYIDVAAGGARYDEMHVDGGVVSQVFLYGPFVDPDEAAARFGIDYRERAKSLYVIVNNKVKGSYDPVPRLLTDIAGAAISSLIRNQGVGALDRLYLIARRDGLDYNLVSIPDDFVPANDNIFDPEVMNDLFDIGFAMGEQGGFWQKHPPGYTPSEEEAADMSAFDADTPRMNEPPHDVAQ